MLFTLEEMVDIDMMVRGYNPKDPLDVIAYWEVRLS
jgi:hypothetical protein